MAVQGMSFQGQVGEGVTINGKQGETRGSEGIGKLLTLPSTHGGFLGSPL